MKKENQADINLVGVSLFALLVGCAGTYLFLVMGSLIYPLWRYPVLGIVATIVAFLAATACMLPVLVHVYANRRDFTTLILMVNIAWSAMFLNAFLFAPGLNVLHSGKAQVNSIVVHLGIAYLWTAAVNGGLHLYYTRWKAKA